MLSEQKQGAFGTEAQGFCLKAGVFHARSTLFQGQKQGAFRTEAQGFCLKAGVFYGKSTLLHARSRVLSEQKHRASA